MKYLKPFLLGLVITALFHLLQVMNCDDGASVSLRGNGGFDGVDMQKINEAGNAIEKAFASGDYKEVEKLLTESAKETYKDELPNLKSEDMKKFASDFKKREFVAAGSYLAEFGFPFQETTYIVQMMIQADGSYKLLRF
jgi:hypothetical protein